MASVIVESKSAKGSPISSYDLQNCFPNSFQVTFALEIDCTTHCIEISGIFKYFT